MMTVLQLISSIVALRKSAKFVVFRSRQFPKVK